MTITNEYGKRLKEERIRLGYTQSLIMKELSIGKSTIINWEQGATFPNTMHLFALSKLGYDIQYLVAGSRTNDKVTNDEYIYIPVYDIEVSAGFGREVDDENCTKYHAYRKRWAKFHGFDPKKLLIVKAVGVSMEPTIKDGEYIVVNTENKYPKNGRIFVIRVRNEIKIKFIETRINGDLILKSANSFYDDEILTPQDLKAGHNIDIIGEAVHGSRDLI